jgi:lycopene cyclase domain-containing protein
MTHLQFLLVFLVAPSALLLALHGARHLRLLAIALGIAAVLALIYTVPWAYVLIKQDVWSFDPDKDGSALWGIPWEGYAAIVVQAIFAGTLTAIALRMAWGRK